MAFSIGLDILGGFKLSEDCAERKLNYQVNPRRQSFLTIKKTHKIYNELN